MKVLTTTLQAPPKHHPDMDMQGAVAITVRVTPKKGDDFYLCNPMDEIIEAREANEPFVAHMVIAMQPKRVIIEPGSIARMEEV